MFPFLQKALDENMCLECNVWAVHTANQGPKTPVTSERGWPPRGGAGHSHKYSVQ